ncbi:MAG: flavodoxin domain-containing protein [Eubacteriales bacterium]
MSKFAVVSWSGTGNTEQMAAAVVEGINAKGGEAVVVSCGDLTPASLGDYAGFAFGCPSMGAEVLEESEFQPMWDGVKSALSGKKVVLFGSYGWGDGEWMRTWVAEAEDCNITVAEHYICNETPGDDELTECKNLGGALVG